MAIHRSATTPERAAAQSSQQTDAQSLGEYQTSQMSASDSGYEELARELDDWGEQFQKGVNVVGENCHQMQKQVAKLRREVKSERGFRAVRNLEELLDESLKELIKMTPASADSVQHINTFTTNFTAVQHTFVRHHNSSTHRHPPAGLLVISEAQSSVTVALELDSQDMARTKIIKPAAKAESTANPQSPVEEVESEHSEFEQSNADGEAGSATRSNKRKSVSSVKTPQSKKKPKRAKADVPIGGLESPTGPVPKTKYTSRDNTVQEIREIAGSLISNLLGREFPAEAVQFRESKSSAKGYSWYVDEGEEFPHCFEREGPMRWLAPERNGVLKMLKEGKLGVEAVMMADEENAAEPPAEGVVPPEEAIVAVPMETDPTGGEAVVPQVPDVTAEDKDADK
ncbi:hypothetical protein H072_2442 [Dactylellina haptotyla CBS 200.50]|uniref:Uncharacterized protein n=1 Tax=Dactylellina haptotyla (strain CBS 200.50) TaxID=1284197 RepID=S8AR63_DACHA|nr:hypothetical protein H072_2442 [Dactylellina haptotyla CBS 200.50]